MKKFIHIRSQILPCLVWVVALFPITALCQSIPADIVVDQYTGQTEIKATNSIKLKPKSETEPFKVPVGNALRVWIVTPEQYLAVTESNHNFIKVEELLTKDATIETNQVNQKKISYQYFDGLGRPIQTIDVKGSPSYKDVVMHQEYDMFGREEKKFLPYTAQPANGLFKASAASDQLNFYNPANPYNNKVKTDGAPYSKTLFEASALNRVSVQGSAGSDWQPESGHGVSYEYQVYHYYDLEDGDSAALPLWNIASVTVGSAPVSIVSTSSYHSSRSLYKNTIRDENSRLTSEFKDKEGNVLYKKIQYDEGETRWAVTSYIYDDYNRLRFVLQPEFRVNLSTYNSASNDGKHDMLKKYAFEYKYDERGRMIYKRVPGADSVEMVYDKWDRLVLSRDGKQRQEGKWAFTKYDASNRIIMTGEFASGASRTAMVSNVNDVNTSHPRFEETASGNNIGYTLTYSYPTTISINDIYTINYYDDYSFISNLGLGTTYNCSGSYYPHVEGHATGTKVRVLGSVPALWLISANYYDDHFRVVHSVSSDHLGNINRITNTYSGITNLVTSTRIEHGTALVSLTETEYDHRGRTLNMFQTLDNNLRILVSSNKYNEIGQLVEKNIHSTNNGATFLQSVDYRYNIRGWLSHINNSQLVSNSTTNDDTNDLFGMELKYNEDLILNQMTIPSQYNGNISYTTWKTNDLVNTPEERIYGYQYDVLNRLTRAEYSSKNGSTWTGCMNCYSEIMGYDYNGNIMHLERNDNVTGMIDYLNYTYSGNRLVNVVDESPCDAPNANKTDFGFTEISQSSNTEYGYDKNGNMNYDLNKGIINITYNHLNLPKLIEFEPQNSFTRTIEYVYSADGVKLSKITKIGSNIISRSDYIGGIQYENDSLSFLASPEGRIIKNESTWQYEYHHKDHLGNVRVAYGILKDVADYKASMETEVAVKEQNQFSNLSASIRSADYNHTRPNAEVPLPNESAKLNGYSGTTVGPAKMLQVKNGERVTMEVYARCPSIVSSGSVVNNLATAVTNAFGLTTAEAGFQVLTDQVPVTAGLINRNTDLPKAYLCYILFNNNYQFVQHGFSKVGLPSQIAFEKLALDITVPSDGYMYIYIANESNVNTVSNAYFDDLSIIHYKSTSSLQVVQTQDYYPFGLPIAPLSYQKESLTKNDYKYNGKELHDELNLNWYDYGARMYMPDIGRFQSIDPLSEAQLDYTPFHYTYNSPINYSDPSGMSPNSIASTFIDEDGKILDVRNDNDRNVYLVHDIKNWDRTKKGLEIVGHTATPTTLKNHIGKNLFSEEIANLIFQEADKLKIDAQYWMSFSQAKNIAELKRNRDLLVKVKKALEIKNQQLLKSGLHEKMLKELLENRANKRRNFSELALIKVLTELILSRIPEKTIILPPSIDDQVISDDEIQRVKEMYDQQFDNLKRHYENLINEYDKAIYRQKTGG